MERHAVAPHDIELEITETALLQDIGRTRAILLALKDLGVSLALDDFGTGYSCMSYIKHFPFGKLKVDRAFVQGVDSDSDLAPLTRGIITMARELGMTVTAEGVEREEELEFLRTCGCDTVQGFLWGEPAHPDKILPLITARRPLMHEFKEVG